MFTRSRLAVIAAVSGLALLGGCSMGQLPGGYGGPAAPAASSSAPASAPSAPSAPVDATAALALAMADSSLGSILVDGNGMTLYLFTNDSPNTSACTGQCLVNWPPLLGEPTAGMGVDASKVGSFAREDGSMQATYNGWPLYYWKADTKAGDVLGQDVNGVWFVIDAAGNAVKN